MNPVRPGNRNRVLASGLGLAAFLACSPAGEPRSTDGILAAAGGKGGGGISVTAADPAYGYQGEQGKTVVITGSGFQPGDQASWQRNGTADPKVQVLSTTYFSSTQLSATINIAVDAELAFYDIAVTGLGRKPGIGTEMFEITQAIVVEGTELLRGVNDAGGMTGRGGGTIYWNPSTGLELLTPEPSSGWQVDQSGTHLVGNRVPRLWTRTGGTWSATELPRDPNSTQGGAFALVSDPVTGQPALIGGQEVNASGAIEPRLWVWQSGTGTWQRIVLPMGSSGTSGTVNEVSDNGVAVGKVGSQSAVWDPNGTGGWTLTILGGGSVEAEGINADGSLIVGAIKTKGRQFSAVYWERLSGGGWSTAIVLPGGCTQAADVDNFGRIAANGCPIPNSSKSSPAVLVPPYSTTTMVRLGSIGPPTSGYVEAMSPSGNYLVGSGGGTGLYWKPF